MKREGEMPGRGLMQFREVRGGFPGLGCPRRDPWRFLMGTPSARVRPLHLRAGSTRLPSPPHLSPGGSLLSELSPWSPSFSSDTLVPPAASNSTGKVSSLTAPVLPGLALALMQVTAQGASSPVFLPEVHCRPPAGSSLLQTFIPLFPQGNGGAFPLSSHSSTFRWPWPSSGACRSLAAACFYLHI